MSDSTGEQAAILQEPNNSSNKNIDSVLRDASSYWPAFVFRGAMLFSLGLVFVIFPETTVNVIGTLFGVMLLLEAFSSVIQMYGVASNVDPNPLRSMVLMYYVFTIMINVILGVLAVTFPDETARILLIIVAVWFVAVGLMQLVMVCLLRASDGDLRRSTAAQCTMTLAGGLYLTFGIVLLSDLDQGVLTFTRLIGAVIMMFAMQVICFGLFVRALSEDEADQAGTGGGDDDDGNTEQKDLTSKTTESDVV